MNGNRFFIIIWTCIHIQIQYRRCIHIFIYVLLLALIRTMRIKIHTVQSSFCGYPELIGTAGFRTDLNQIRFLGKRIRDDFFTSTAVPLDNPVHLIFYAFDIIHKVRIRINRSTGIHFYRLQISVIGICLTDTRINVYIYRRRIGNLRTVLWRIRRRDLRHTGSLWRNDTGCRHICYF